MLAKDGDSKVVGMTIICRTHDSIRNGIVRNQMIRKADT